MHSRIFFAILPALLCSTLPALALPAQQSQAIEARSLDASSDVALQFSRDISEEDLVERFYLDDEADILARAVDEETLFARGGGKDKPRAALKVVKAAKKAEKALKKANKAAKKADKLGRKLEAHHLGTAKLGHMAPGLAHALGGKGEHSLEHHKDFRLAGRPNALHAGFAKGDHLHPKAKASQEAAHLRMQEKKAEGRTKFGAAAASHREALHNGHLPGRHDELHGLHHSASLSGKNIRKGAFNSALHGEHRDSEHGGRHSSEFRHQEGGLREHRHSSEFPHAHSSDSGREHSSHRGGYHPSAAGRFQHNSPEAGGMRGYNRHGGFPHERTHEGGHRGFGERPHSPFSRHSWGSRRDADYE